MKKFLQKLFIISICALLIANLTGCGFRPRGIIKLPHQFHTMYFESNVPYGKLTRQLTSSLEMSGVHIVDAASKAPLTLTLLTETISTPQTTIGGSQLTRDYTVTYSVSYVLKNSSGDTIYTPKRITEQKTITLDPQEMIENSDKLSEAKQIQRQNIINRILLQLSSRNVYSALEHLQSKPLITQHENPSKPIK